MAVVVPSYVLVGVPMIEALSCLGEIVPRAEVTVELDRPYPYTGMLPLATTKVEALVGEVTLIPVAASGEA